MPMNIRHPLITLCLSCLPAWQTAAAPAALDAAIESTVQTNEESRQSQQKIEQLSDDTDGMLREYRNTLQQIDSLKSYNQQLEKLITSQEETLSSITRQLATIEETQRNIVPFLLHMIDTLDKFIALDMPFLLAERQARLQTIKDMMDRPDVSLPEKFRRIMEAYQIEMEYGRSMGASSETIRLDGKNSTVDVLQVGRIALLYQSLDGKMSGYWDKTEKAWKTLPGDYNPSIKKGILIAREQSSPDFFKIPVPAPEHLP